MDIKLNFIGHFAFTIDGKIVHLSSRKSQATLAYLQHSSGYIGTRSKLATLLWSEKDDFSARVSLRQELRSLKKVLNSPERKIIKSDNISIWLDLPPDSHELQGLYRDLQLGRIPQKLLDTDLVHETILENLSGIDTEFDHWLNVVRSTTQDKLIKHFRNVINDEDHADAHVDAYTALSKIDPTDEIACMGVISTYCKNGQESRAKKYASHFERELKRNYDVQPSERFQEFVSNLNKSEVAAVKLPRISKPEIKIADKLVIAISDFNIPGDDAQLYQLVSLFRNELIVALTKFNHWTVINQAADNQTGQQDIYGIIGNCVQIGNELHISIFLQNYKRESVWSDSFILSADNWAAERMNAIRKISCVLDKEISVARLAETLGREKLELGNHDLWIKGRFLMSSWKPEEEAEAEAIFREIQANRGSFTPALTCLSQILNTRHHIFPGILRDKKREEEALKIAKTVARLTPRDCHAQLAAGWSYLLNRQYENAEYYFDLAYSLNDSDLSSIISSAQGYCFIGNKIRAGKLVQHALELSRSVSAMDWAYIACIYFYLKNFNEALNAIERAEGAAFFVNGMHGAILGHLGRLDDAEREIQRFVKEISANWYGRVEPTPESVLHWFLQVFPINLEADWELLRGGIQLSVKQLDSKAYRQLRIV